MKQTEAAQNLSRIRRAIDQVAGTRYLRFSYHDQLSREALALLRKIEERTKEAA